VAGLTDVFDAVAQVVGGSAPDATNRPRWFSGVDSADGTGIAGINGCYSGPQQQYFNPPVGVVMSVRQRLANPIRDTLTQGTELREADFSLYILDATDDQETQFGIISAFPDLVYSAFASHVGLFSLSNEYQAAVVADDGPKKFSWSGKDFIAWEFTIRVLRDFYGRTYSA
jgi:hypothetical protein